MRSSHWAAGSLTWAALGLRLVQGNKTHFREGFPFWSLSSNSGLSLQTSRNGHLRLRNIFGTKMNNREASIPTSFLWARCGAFPLGIWLWEQSAGGHEGCGPGQPGPCCVTLGRVAPPPLGGGDKGVVLGQLEAQMESQSRSTPGAR